MTTPYDTSDIPYGYCHCGCGEKTSIAKKTSTREGVKKGEPHKFARCHNSRFLYGHRVEKFWNQVNKNGSIPAHNPSLGSCWEWTGRLDHMGYGRFRFEHKRWLTHRLSWKFTNGTLDPNICVLHKCDNPLCLNPDHLFLGTLKDNSEDMVAKGRQGRPRGELQGRHKLTWKQVELIRTRYASGGVTQQQLADEIGTTQGNIGRIVRGEMWKK